MRYYIFLLLLAICITGKVTAQKKFNASEYSLRIAQRMRDTLQLSADDYNAVLSVNVKLQNEMKAVLENNTDRKILQQKLVEVEKTRDAKYQQILSRKKYDLYRSKKSAIFNIR